MTPLLSVCGVGRSKYRGLGAFAVGVSITGVDDGNATGECCWEIEGLGTKERKEETADHATQRERTDDYRIEPNTNPKDRDPADEVSHRCAYICVHSGKMSRS